ncbi:2-amino-4-hydroxy-6-hydroxymethyldihydropteridine diphosphokinase [Pseudooceanicola sp. MF1-13]|uniref:2-amino-4-hydroxy-6- hydroxymethyldihydropteridine diphosphokinase n=1 Tax=Pseudooceanicola sp. MF1-13 TaxID=3379095 RepID=UPI003892A127
MTFGKLVAIGGNLSPEGVTTYENLQSAVARIGELIGPVTALSSWYSTPAFPAGSGPDFLNAALCVYSDLPAADVLPLLHQIEAEHGRVRRDRWGPRTVDLDLIADADHVVPDVGTWRHWADLSIDQQMQAAPDGLILPHPRLQDRSFVLVPLNEICPDWVHPVLGLTIAQMHADLTENDRKSVVKLADPACQ